MDKTNNQNNNPNNQNYINQTYTNPSYNKPYTLGNINNNIHHQNTFQNMQMIPMQIPMNLPYGRPTTHCQIPPNNNNHLPNQTQAAINLPYMMQQGALMQRHPQFQQNLIHHQNQTGQLNPNNKNNIGQPNNPLVNYYNPVFIQNVYRPPMSMNARNPQHPHPHHHPHPHPHYNPSKNFNNNFVPFQNTFKTNQNQNQFPNQQNFSNNSQIPAKPLSKEDQEELTKWIESRKRNFPSATNVELKQNKEKIREEAGTLSKLELKLKQKVKILNKLNKKPFNNNNNNRQRNGNVNNYNGGAIKRHDYKNNNNQFGRRKKDEKFERFNNREKGNCSDFQKKNLMVKKDDEEEEGEIRDEENEALTMEMVNKEEGEVKDNIDNINNEQQRSFYNNFEHKRENFRTQRQERKEKQKRTAGFHCFVYRKNNIIEELQKSDKIKELNIILQAFKYFEDENLI